MALNVRKCKECGKIFQYVGKDCCHECLQKLDDWFMKIRDYLDEHPNAKINDVSEKLEIRERVILDFIRQGRIMLKEAVLTCANCGRPIYGGELCDDCKVNISSKISAAVDTKRQYQEPAEAELKFNRTGGMHVKG